MSQIMTGARIGIAIASLAVMLSACSTENSNNDINASTGSHPASWQWTAHVSPAQENVDSCKECHGQDLAGGVAAVACSSCHVNGIATMTGCVSCHAAPPSGTMAPNRSGAHAVHNGLANVTGVCNTCHNNAGSGTEKHNIGTTQVNFLSAYNAKSGAAVFNADGTCTNVSCHGGQTTPVWSITSVIDVNNECTSCHSYGFPYAIPQYNSYSSGQHYFHVVVRGMPCYTCHDTSKLAQNHFTSLNTSTMEGPASATIQGSMYDPVNHTCAAVCHETKAW